MGCDNTGIGLPATITSVSPSQWYPGKTYNVLITGVFPGNASPTVLPGCDYTEVYVYDNNGYLGMQINGNYIGLTETSFTITVPANTPSETAYVTLTCDGGCSLAQWPVQIGCPAPTITSIKPSTWFAGKEYDDVAIVGTNFVTKDKATTGCPETTVNITAADGSVVPVSAVKVDSQTKITFTIAPPTSDPTETATVTVGTTTNTANSANLATQPQILGNQILFKNKPVNSPLSPPPVAVGQQIALTTPDLPSGMTATKMTWTVDGTRIAGYTPTPASASVQELTDSDLKKANMTFYWVYPENPIEVTYQYCVDIPGVGNQCSEEARAEFEVDGPSDVTVKPSDMTFFISGNPEAMIWSIEFDATATSPPSNDGEYTWVQLITVKEIGDFDDGTGSTCTGGPGLDTQYPYETGLHSEDGYVDPIDSTYEKEERTNSEFHMYLMWNPLTDGSIPVPLGSIAWSASGDVVWSPTSKTWKKISGGTKSDDFSTQSPSFPQWKGGPVTPETIAANCK